MHVMMRQIMALFDEYQSKENAKHVIRALKENAAKASGTARFPLSATASSRPSSAGQDQEEAGDRPAPRRHRAADLPAGAGRRPPHRPDGRPEPRLPPQTPPPPTPP